MLDPNPTTRPDSNKLVQYFEYLESICSNRTSRFFTLPLYRLLELSMEENCRKQSVMFKKEPLVSTSRLDEGLTQNCRSLHKKVARCRIVVVGDDATASNAPPQKAPLSTPLLSRKLPSSLRNCDAPVDQLEDKTASNASPPKGPLSTPLLGRKISSSPRNCVALEDQLREKKVIDTNGEPSPNPGGQSRQLSYRKSTTTQRVKTMQRFAAVQCFTRAQHFNSPTESCERLFKTEINVLGKMMKGMELRGNGLVKKDHQRRELLK